MHTIELKSESKILIGESINNVGKYITNKQFIVICDENIFALYEHQFPNSPLIKIGLGESIKTLETVNFIVEELINLQADRHTFLLAIGGGVVCDIVGFVASIYMRGIDFGFVSTSLLSQIDASVGGKNGVNFNAYKNLIGNFNQPKFVICDIKMLQTLPHREWLSGMGELLKYSLISNKVLFEIISEKGNVIFDFDEEFWRDLVYENLRVKVSIVQKDEKEQGERKKLNLGHTLAHAIENQKNISHGHAVVLGIVFAAKVSHLKQYLTNIELNQIIKTIQNLGFDINLYLDKAQLKKAILHDKKKHHQNIDFVMLKSIGSVEVEMIEIEQLNQWIDDLC